MPGHHFPTVALCQPAASNGEMKAAMSGRQMPDVNRLALFQGKLTESCWENEKLEKKHACNYIYNVPISIAIQMCVYRVEKGRKISGNFLGNFGNITFWNLSKNL